MCVETLHYYSAILEILSKTGIAKLKSYAVFKSLKNSNHFPGFIIIVIIAFALTTCRSHVTSHILTIIYLSLIYSAKVDKKAKHL
jgi:di/tricarboxylate transporter